MAGALRQGGLRARLLTAFLVLSVIPVLLLAAAVTALVSRTFERTEREHLAASLRGAQTEIRRLKERAAARIVAAGRDVADVTSSELDRELADRIASRGDLEALEIVDAQGRLVSSHHWREAFGLEDRDGLFPGDPTLRVEKVEEHYGGVDRLALMPAQATTLHGAPVTVRGGPFLDSEFLAGLGGLMGVQVALRDVLRARWIVPPASPFESWPDPPLGKGPASGEVVLGGTPHRWAAASLHPSLWLVAAAPRTPLDRVLRQLWMVSLGTAAAVLVAALVAAVVVSSRIARPVTALAAGARRIAEGDLPAVVEAGSHDEIADLARAFNTMSADLRASRERLLQAERVAAWREMARRLAHELKNPIFPIQLSIETLRMAHSRQATGPADAGRFDALFKESSDTILAELQALMKIIEEFSEFARMPRPRPGPVDLNALVQRVVALNQARNASVRVQVETAADVPPVNGDRDLLARAVSNLVANAFEAMPEGGTLRLQTSAAAGGVVLEVTDSGPGLTEEQRTRLFTPYFTTKKGGTGLGLAIVQGIVSDHGGRIEVRSRPGEGTSFTILLPRVSSRGDS